jgi:mannitol/fructose-specific phosphotransferase system IIA component
VKTKLEGVEHMDDNYILRRSNILLGLDSIDKYNAIKMTGQRLFEDGYVEREYIDAMIERENDLSTYIGKGVAIPHGVGASRNCIKKSGMVVLQFPEGVDFGGEKAYLIIGIAGLGNEHISILSNIATVLDDENEDKIERLKKTDDVNYVYNIFTA